MATSQATFGEIEPTDTTTDAPTDQVPRWLENPSSISAGAKILVDRNDHDTERAYTVTETRAGSLFAERGGKTIQLRKRAGEWYHHKSDFSSTVRLIATTDHPVLTCCDCGDACDPATFGRRQDYEFTCQGCLE